jgi:polyphosphate kinase
MMTLVKRETEAAQRGEPARIIAKMNALVDREIIEALYRASQAGVKIDLIVRGTCCLRPGVPEISENITVRSIVGRFLEHCRIFYFENGGDPKVFIGSADWMPRNFFRRIEVVTPVEETALRDRIINQILAVQLGDTAKATFLKPDGLYAPAATVKPGAGRNSQSEFMALALGESMPRRKAAAKRKFPVIRLEPRPR